MKDVLYSTTIHTQRLKKTATSLRGSYFKETSRHEAPASHHVCSGRGSPLGDPRSTWVGGSVLARLPAVVGRGRVGAVFDVAPCADDGVHVQNRVSV